MKPMINFMLLALILMLARCFAQQQQQQEVLPSVEPTPLRTADECYINRPDGSNNTQCNLPFTYKAHENDKGTMYYTCPKYADAMPYDARNVRPNDVWCPAFSEYRLQDEETRTEWYPCSCVGIEETLSPTASPTAQLSCRLRKIQPVLKLLKKGTTLRVGDSLEVCKFPFTYKAQTFSECIVEPGDENDPDLKWGWCITESNTFGTCACSRLSSTDAPTGSPSQPTTAAPSQSPTTLEPTAFPSALPTLSPSPKPTPTPTSSPSVELFNTVTFQIHLRLNRFSFEAEPTEENLAEMKKTVMCYLNWMILRDPSVPWGVQLPIDDEYPDALVHSVDIEREEGDEGEFRIQFKMHTDALNINEIEALSESPTDAPTLMPSPLYASNSSNITAFPTGTPSSAPTSSKTVEAYIEELIGDVGSDLYLFQLGKWGTLSKDQGDGILFNEDGGINYTYTPIRYTSGARFCTRWKNWQEVAPLQNSTEPTASPTNPQGPDPGAPLSTESKIALGVVIPFFFVALVALFVRLKKKSKIFRKCLGIESPPPLETFIDPAKKVDAANPNFAQFKDLHIELSQLTLGRPIGHGANGRIFRATYCGSDVAVKELFPEILKNRTDSNANNDWESIWREVKHLRLLRHPHIIQLYGCTKVTRSNTNRCLLVMELATCSLLELLNGSPKAEPLSLINTDLHRKILLTRQVCAGCAYIHDNNMIHFDIKPANILLDMSGNAKICDLGIAKITKGPNSRIDMTASAMGGTPPYMAPELLRGDTELIGTPVDVYGFGIVLWQIFHRKSPHPSDWTIAKLFHEVMMNNYRPEIEVATLGIPQIVDIMQSCWHADCEKRPTFHMLIRAFDRFLAAGSESERERSDPERVYEVNDIVGVWGPSRKYVPARILAVKVKVGLDERSGSEEVLYDIEFVHDEEKKMNVSANDLIQYSPDFTLNTMSPFKSIVGLALEHAEGVHGLGLNSTGRVPQGMSLKFVRDTRKDQPSISTGVTSTLASQAGAGKTFKFAEGQLELQGLKFTKDGVNLELDRPRVNKAVLMKYALLGQGASGKVHAALHIPTFTLVAVKDIRFVEKHARHQAVRELKVLWRNLVNIPSASVAVTPKAAANGAKSPVIQRAKSHSFTKTIASVISSSSSSASGESGSGSGSSGSGGGDKGKEKEGESEVERPEEESTAAREPLQLQQCPQIVALYDAYLDEEEECVSLVMEHMDGGSLQDIIDKHCPSSSTPTPKAKVKEAATTPREEEVVATGICDESVLADIARDVLRAIRFLHAHELIHLDIKPANVLLNIHGRAKLADFGLAKQLEAVRQFHANTFVGTMRYMSPERLSGSSYSFSSDVWSFALTMMTVVLGKFPVTFNRGESPDEEDEGSQGSGPGVGAATEAKTGGAEGVAMDKDKDSDRKGGSVYWSLLELFRKDKFPMLPKSVKLTGSLHEQSPRKLHSFSDDFIDFLRQGLQIDPAQRSSAEGLLQHPWLMAHTATETRLNKFELAQAHRSRLSLILQSAVDVPGLLCTQRDANEISIDEEKLIRLAEQLDLSIEVVKSELALILNATPVEDAANPNYNPNPASQG